MRRLRRLLRALGTVPLVLSSATQRLLNRRADHRAKLTRLRESRPPERGRLPENRGGDRQRI